jgi:hypothetical protein
VDDYMPDDGEGIYGLIGECRIDATYHVPLNSLLVKCQAVWTSPRKVDTQLRVYNHPGRSSNATQPTHLHS